jgi:hypothetical protein
LSERAQQLIPKAKIISFAKGLAWE